MEEQCVGVWVPAWPLPGCLTWNFFMNFSYFLTCKTGKYQKVDELLLEVVKQCATYNVKLLSGGYCDDGVFECDWRVHWGEHVRLKVAWQSATQLNQNNTPSAITVVYLVAFYLEYIGGHLDDTVPWHVTVSLIFPLNPMALLAIFSKAWLILKHWWIKWWPPDSEFWLKPTWKYLTTCDGYMCWSRQADKLREITYSFTLKVWKVRELHLVQPLWILEDLFPNYSKYGDHDFPGRFSLLCGGSPRSRVDIFSYYITIVHCFY